MKTISAKINDVEKAYLRSKYNVAVKKCIDDYDGLNDTEFEQVLDKWDIQLIIRTTSLNTLLLINDLYRDRNFGSYL